MMQQELDFVIKLVCINQAVIADIKRRNIVI